MMMMSQKYSPAAQAPTVAHLVSSKMPVAQSLSLAEHVLITSAKGVPASATPQVVPSSQSELDDDAGAMSDDSCASGDSVYITNETPAYGQNEPLDLTTSLSRRTSMEEDQNGLADIETEEETIECMDLTTKNNAHSMNSNVSKTDNIEAKAIASQDVAVPISSLQNTPHSVPAVTLPMFTTMVSGAVRQINSTEHTVTSQSTDCLNLPSLLSPTRGAATQSRQQSLTQVTASIPNPITFPTCVAETIIPGIEYSRQQQLRPTSVSESSHNPSPTMMALSPTSLPDKVSTTEAENQFCPASHELSSATKLHVAADHAQVHDLINWRYPTQGVRGRGSRGSRGSRGARSRRGSDPTVRGSRRGTRGQGRGRARGSRQPKVTPRMDFETPATTDTSADENIVSDTSENVTDMALPPQHVAVPAPSLDVPSMPMHAYPIPNQGPLLPFIPTSIPPPHLVRLPFMHRGPIGIQYVRIPTRPQQPAQYVCKLCGFDSTEEAPMHTHVKTSHWTNYRGQFVCKECLMVTINWPNFKSHVSRYHSGQDPLTLIPQQVFNILFGYFVRKPYDQPSISEIKGRSIMINFQIAAKGETYGPNEVPTPLEHTIPSFPATPTPPMSAATSVVEEMKSQPEQLSITYPPAPHQTMHQNMVQVLSPPPSQLLPPLQHPPPNAYPPGVVPLTNSMPDAWNRINAQLQQAQGGHAASMANQSPAIMQHLVSNAAAQMTPALSTSMLNISSRSSSLVSTNGSVLSYHNKLFDSEGRPVEHCSISSASTPLTRFPHTSESLARTSSALTDPKTVNSTEGSIETPNILPPTAMQTERELAIEQDNMTEAAELLLSLKTGRRISNDSQMHDASATKVALFNESSQQSTNPTVSTSETHFITDPPRSKDNVEAKRRISGGNESSNLNQVEKSIESQLQAEPTQSKQDTNLERNGIRTDQNTVKETTKKHRKRRRGKSRNIPRTQSDRVLRFRMDTSKKIKTSKVVDMKKTDNLVLQVRRRGKGKNNKPKGVQIQSDTTVKFRPEIKMPTKPEIYIDVGPTCEEGSDEMKKQGHRQHTKFSRPVLDLPGECTQLNDSAPATENPAVVCNVKMNSQASKCRMIDTCDDASNDLPDLVPPEEVPLQHGTNAKTPPKYSSSLPVQDLIPRSFMKKIKPTQALQINKESCLAMIKKNGRTQKRKRNQRRRYIHISDSRMNEIFEAVIERDNTTPRCLPTSPLKSPDTFLQTPFQTSTMPPPKTLPGPPFQTSSMPPPKTLPRPPFQTSPMLPPKTLPRQPLQTSPMLPPKTLPRPPFQTSPMTSPKTLPRPPLQTSPMTPPKALPRQPLQTSSPTIAESLPKAPIVISTTPKEALPKIAFQSSLPTPSETILNLTLETSPPAPPKMLPATQISATTLAETLPKTAIQTLPATQPVKISGTPLQTPLQMTPEKLNGTMMHSTPTPPAVLHQTTSKTPSAMPPTTPSKTATSSGTLSKTILQSSPPKPSEKLPGTKPQMLPPTPPEALPQLPSLTAPQPAPQETHQTVPPRQVETSLTTKVIPPPPTVLPPPPPPPPARPIVCVTQDTPVVTAESSSSPTSPPPPPPPPRCLPAPLMRAVPPRPPLPTVKQRLAAGEKVRYVGKKSTGGLPRKNFHPKILSVESLADNIIAKVPKQMVEQTVPEKNKLTDNAQKDKCVNKPEAIEVVVKSAVDIKMEPESREYEAENLSKTTSASNVEADALKQHYCADMQVGMSSSCMSEEKKKDLPADSNICEVTNGHVSDTPNTTTCVSTDDAQKQLTTITEDISLNTKCNELPATGAQIVESINTSSSEEPPKKFLKRAVVRVLKLPEDMIKMYSSRKRKEVEPGSTNKEDVSKSKGPNIAKKHKESIEIERNIMQKAYSPSYGKDRQPKIIPELPISKPKTLDRKSDKTTNETWECLLCSFASRKMSPVWNHVCNKHIKLTPYACLQCSRRGWSYEKMEEHILTIHKNVTAMVITDQKLAKKQEQVADILCTPAYFTPEDVKHQLEKLVPMAKFLLGSPILSDEESAKCAECHAEFKSVILYRRHLRSHKHTTSKVCSITSVAESNGTINDKNVSNDNTLTSAQPYPKYSQDVLSDKNIPNGNVQKTSNGDNGKLASAPSTTQDLPHSEGFLGSSVHKTSTSTTEIKEAVAETLVHISDEVSKNQIPRIRLVARKADSSSDRCAWDVLNRISDVFN